MEILFLKELSIKGFIHGTVMFTVQMTRIITVVSLQTLNVAKVTMRVLPETLTMPPLGRPRLDHFGQTIMACSIWQEMLVNG